MFKYLYILFLFSFLLLFIFLTIIDTTYRLSLSLALNLLKGYFIYLITSLKFNYSIIYLKRRIELDIEFIYSMFSYIY